MNFIEGPFVFGHKCPGCGTVMVLRPGYEVVDLLNWADEYFWHKTSQCRRQYDPTARGGPVA